MTTAAADQRENSPAYRCPAYLGLESQRAKCRDLVGGTTRIQMQYKTYLQQHPREQPEDYERRSKTELYNGFSRVVVAGTGLVFARDPELDAGAPALVKDQWENIDGLGTHGSVFAKRMFREGVTVGLVAVLVDYPAVNIPITLEQQIRFGIRPYWVMLRAEQLLSWRFETQGGYTFLKQIVIWEPVEEEDGAYGVKTVNQYRVFKNDPPGQVTWELYREVRNDKGEVTWEDAGHGMIVGQTEIPIAFAYIGEYKGPLTVCPPLTDLADVNLAHWRVMCDRRYAMHLASVPTPVRIGYQSPVQRPGGSSGQHAGQGRPIGPNWMIDVPQGGDFKWVAAPSDVLAPSRDEIKDLEQRMASLGLSFLASDTRAAETAMAKTIDNQAQNATLATAAQALEDCLEQALVYHCNYLGIKVAPSITINTDFEGIILDAQTLTALNSIVTAGNLTIETFLRILRRGGVIPKDVDPSQEQKTLQAQAPVPNPDLPVNPDDAGPIPAGTPPTPQDAAGRAGRVARDESGRS